MRVKNWSRERNDDVPRLTLLQNSEPLEPHESSNPVHAYVGSLNSIREGENGFAVKVASAGGDGLNNNRAIRIAEILNDYRNIQTQIASVRFSPPQDQMQQPAYVILRQCQQRAQALLATPFSGGQGIGNPQRDDEATKASLRRIAFDASARRFQAFKIYLQTMAAVRWVQAWSQVSRGQPTIPPAAQQALDQRLRNELASITDQMVFQQLRAKDTASGYWLIEDPTLPQILALIQAR